MIVTYPNGTKRFVSYGRQDSEYDNTLSQWGAGDFHPSRKVRWYKVAGLVIAFCPWTLIAAAVYKLLHRH